MIGLPQHGACLKHVIFEGQYTITGICYYRNHYYRQYTKKIGEYKEEENGRIRTDRSGSD